jgi:hypothetical protein
MNVFRVHHCVAVRLLWLALAVLLMRPLGAVGATEDTFEVLHIGTRTYTNVTVTTKAKTYIFILHAGGMASIKVSEISPELQQQLGYGAAPASKSATNTAAVWVKKEIAKIDVPQIKGLKKQLDQWRAHPSARAAVMAWIGPKPNYTVLGVALAVCLLLYLFYSYCCAVDLPEDWQRAGHLGLPACAAASPVAPRRRHVRLVARGLLCAGAEPCAADSLASADCQGARQERLGRRSAAAAGHQPVRFSIPCFFRRGGWDR